MRTKKTVFCNDRYDFTSKETKRAAIFVNGAHFVYWKLCRKGIVVGMAFTEDEVFEFLIYGKKSKAKPSLAKIEYVEWNSNWHYFAFPFGYFL